MSALPLVGRRILVTRSAQQAGKLSDGLRALGAEPVEVPVLEIRPPSSLGELDRALRELDTYDWLIFTSANTVRAVAERAMKLGIEAASAKSAKIAAVGEATAAEIRKAGLQVAFIPERYVAESLVAGFPEPVPGKRILLARAAAARDVIPNALREAGAQVDVADAYQNVIPKNALRLLREAAAQPLDAATFTSSSSVTHLAEVAAAAQIHFPLLGVAAISIGPITSQTLREHGWEPSAEADPHDVQGLIAATIAALHSEKAEG